MFGGFPIDDIPDPIDIRSFVIVVLLSLALDTHGRRDNYLKIVCMLPHINTKDRCEITNDRVLILYPKSISDRQGDLSAYGLTLVVIMSSWLVFLIFTSQPHLFAKRSEL